VAEVATEHGVPCLVLAGRVEISRREAAAAGITAAYGLVDQPGGPERALAEPAAALRDMAARVAAGWSR